jgi:hypothetical protein
MLPRADSPQQPSLWRCFDCYHRLRCNVLEKAIFSAKPNMLDSAKLRVDYYLFKVKQITASSEQSLAQVQSSIRKQLTTEQQQRTFTEFIKAWRKKWAARTDCHTGYVVPGCRQYKGPIVANDHPSGVDLR